MNHLIPVHELYHRYIYSITAIFIALTNIIFCQNKTLSFLLVLAESLVLFVYFFKRQYIQYFCFYIIFSALSMEYEIFSSNGKFYGFRKFKLLGINISIWFLLLLFLGFLINKNHKIKIKFYSKELTIFISGMLVCWIMGFITGISNFILDDNNISQLGNIFIIYLSEVYTASLPLFIIFNFVFLISAKPEVTVHLKKTIIYVLFGLGFQLLFSFFFKIYGSYGQNDIILASVAVILIPFVVLLPLYGQKITSSYIITLFSIILSLLYAASGKYILTLSIVLLLFPFIILKHRHYLCFGIILFFLCAALIYLFPRVNSLLQDNDLLQDKMNQVISMLCFWKDDWLELMAPSPRIRVLELINTFFEYMEKPLYFLFGKGFGGTFKNHMSLMTFVSDSYTKQEWINQTFWGTHGSFNKFFLSYGFFGIVLFLYIIKQAFFNFHNSFWLLLGVFWFALFYGYSFSLMIIGLPCLMIGLAELGKKKGRNL